MTKVERIGAILGWGSLLAMYWMMFTVTAIWHLPAATLNFFSYFSVLSTLMITIAFTWPARNRHPAKRGAIALYTTITGLIYFLLLRHSAATHGVLGITNIILHYVLPPLYLYEWLRLPRTAPLPWKYAFYWLSFPALYAIFTLIHGALSGFYPYYFFDVKKYGYPAILTNMGMLGLVFLVIGLQLIAVDRRRRH